MCRRTQYGLDEMCQTACSHQTCIQHLIGAGSRETGEEELWDWALICYKHNMESMLSHLEKRRAMYQAKLPSQSRTWDTDRGLTRLQDLKACVDVAFLFDRSCLGIVSRSDLLGYPAVLYTVARAQQYS